MPLNHSIPGMNANMAVVGTHFEGAVELDVSDHVREHPLREGQFSMLPDAYFVGTSSGRNTNVVCHRVLLLVSIR
jgi:hypothetical protein